MELGRLHVAGRAGAARRDDADAIVHGCLCADHLSALRWRGEPFAGAGGRVRWYKPAAVRDVTQFCDSPLNEAEELYSWPHTRTCRRLLQSHISRTPPARRPGKEDAPATRAA